MGNCVEISQGQEDAWYALERERIDNTVILREHQTLLPYSPLKASINLRDSRRIDEEKLHNTLARQALLNFVATRTEHRKDWQQKDKIELLNYAFLHTLGLSEYSFHPVSDPDFANLEIAESKDSYGVVYLGEWKNKLPHGNGVLTSNTCKYIGQFKQGLKHFHGREILSHEVYEGTFENGNRKGEGVLYSKEATKTGLFDGDLVDGEIVYSNHDCYKGKLQDGKYTGSGNVFEQARSGILYRNATFESGVLSWAEIIYPNKNIYIGSIKSGCKHGQGIFKWTKESKEYRGEYRCDLKHGRGRLKEGMKEIEVEFENGIMVQGEDTLGTNESAHDERSQIPADWLT